MTNKVSNILAHLINILLVLLIIQVGSGVPKHQVNYQNKYSDS